jgi:tRNA dimethylallyltransferase
MEKKILCRVLTGPTASGKSDIAFRMAAAHGWEIVCMDSMQIYRGMDIGTAKPSREEQETVPHHLLDICDPRENYSVSRYVQDAEQCVREIAGRGREALFVGGTGLYLEGLVKGMSLGNIPANEELRAELRALAEGEEGRRLLDERLRKCDPATAEKLPLNDLRRRIRAIEVSESTGNPFSAQPEATAESPFDWILVSTCMEREDLYGRINARVDRMMEDGLAEEVRRLLSEGVPEDAQSMQAIGYKEMVPFLRGEYTLEAALEEIRKRTRHYAKRQMTFLKRMEGIRYVDSEAREAYAQIEGIFRI